MPIIISSTPTATDLESLILDGLELNNYPFFIESINFGLPASLAEWVKGADSNGALLGRPPLYENRVIEARISIQQQATMNAALGHIATIEDKLQECAQNAAGLALVWSPAESTLDAITFRCLLGEIVDLPIGWESGYFSKAPQFGIRLTCLPFGEGAEYLAGSVTASTDPMQTMTISNVPGDVPALGRLVVTDAATQSRRWICWGLESRWLPTSGAPSLIIDSASMVTTGFAGVTGTRSGAYSGASNNVITATLETRAQAICGLGNLSHVGEFRPHLRVYASATTMQVRLTWQSLDGPFRSLSYKVPVAVGWNLIDMGLVTISPTVLGTQRWTAKIEAQSSDTGGEILDVDAVLLLPAQIFSRARGTYSRQAGVLTGVDSFTGITAGTALGGRVAPKGGTWTTSGAVTDFVAADGPVAGDETMSRATTSDGGLGRVALLGSTSYTNTGVGLDFIGTVGLIVRGVDDSNFLRVRVASNGFTTVRPVQTLTEGDVLAQGYVPLPLTAWRTVRIVVYESGNGIAQITDRTSGAVLLSLAFSSALLATGGALASGKPGFLDRGDVGMGTRYFDNFDAETPASEAIACYANRSIEFRHDTTLRQDSTGTYAGPPPEAIGGRFVVPQAGGPNRSTRIAVVARRNDVETLPDDNIADSTTVEVRITPRFLCVPRT